MARAASPPPPPPPGPPSCQISVWGQSYYNDWEKEPLQHKNTIGKDLKGHSSAKQVRTFVFIKAILLRFVSFATKWLHSKWRDERSGNLQGSENWYSQQQDFVLQGLLLAGEDCRLVVLPRLIVQNFPDFLNFSLKMRQKCRIFRYKINQTYAVINLLLPFWNKLTNTQILRARRCRTSLLPYL